MQRFLLLWLALMFTGGHFLVGQSCDFKSDIISLGGDSHDNGFGRNDNNDAVATLSNGNFVIGWSTDDGIDGDQAGAYFQVFSENGTAITSATVPYAAINPAGTGDQGVFGPKVVALNEGFVIAWTSEDGPGDTGPAGDEQQDVFIRTYTNAGVAISDPIRISVAGEEDLLAYVMALSTGNFVVITGTDEDNSGNKDDYYFQVFNPSGTSLSGGLVNISGSAHDAAYQTVDRDQPIVDLGDGNFAIAWDTWDDVDGDDKGAFLRIFKSDGSAVTGIIIPYADINAAGMGDQGVPEPRLLKLANGNFVMAWVSEQGPGDIGPGGDFNDDQDVYFRIYQANGTPVTASLKANSDNAADEESLDGLIALEGGNFSMIYRNDEDQAGNTDDYFVRTFSPTGMALGASIELSAGAHLNSFVRTLGNRSYAALSNGNFVLGWSPDRSADGDSTSAYFRVFDASGNPLTAIAAPYADINSGGTGPQSTNGPLIKALPNGFAIVWESADGPTDVGPGNNRDYDTYHRVYDNTGMALCGTKKTNMGSDGEEERPVFVQALDNGDFVVMYRDEETNGNKDDFFARVIGGAPAVNICPTIGEITVSSTCGGQPFSITVSGLENMAQADNGEQDYGISFYALLSGDPEDLYGSSFGRIGIVPFSELGDGGASATLLIDENLIDFVDVNPLIIAILDATPADAACRPFATLTRQVNTKPFVSLAAPGNFCADAGVQTGLGNVTPAGGVFSGPGITDDGNGSTYSFNPATAGVGSFELTYTFTTGESCTFTEIRTFEVFAAPTATFTAPEDLDADAGVQAGLSGGTPAQGTAEGDMGVYSGPGVTDDGNGMTYSFDPAAAGVGVHTITYTYTDGNGCLASASDDIEVTMQIPPGNACADANDINSLFGQAIDEAQLSEVFDNTTYTVDPSDPSTGTDCFFDGRTAPIWFTFTGDGNRYRIKTTTSGTDNPIPAGDTQMALYTGECGTLSPLACSEDEDESLNLYNAILELDTEVGVTYRILIDGVASSLGNGRGAFRVEVTQVMVVNVTNIEETPIQLFPNPTTGILHWQNVTPDEVQVFDYTGKLVLSGQQPTTNLNISALPSGFYLLKIREGKEVYSAKIVKE